MSETRMTDEGFIYGVTKRERGDYATPNGPEETVYMGPSSEHALAAAHEAAREGGKIVRIDITVRRRRE